mmetsp:Transcript_20522/g.27010  ORF Transcript_20522/g.27010 Transcript_20522/m.27010 type:complete len:84 (+) Transcript_20522:95-346(+)
MSNRICHFKLVLLGDTAVGKSCLVVRFVRDEFFEFQEPTIGGEKENDSVNANCGVIPQHFDFAGLILTPGLFTVFYEMLVFLP